MCWVPLSARVDMCVLCPLRKRSFGEDDKEETESALLAARRPLAAKQRGRKASCQRLQPVVRLLAQCHSHTCLEKCACGNTQVVDDTSVSGVQRGAEKIQEVMVRTTSALLTFILGFSTRRNKRTRSAVRREWRMDLKIGEWLLVLADSRRLFCAALTYTSDRHSIFLGTLGRGALPTYPFQRPCCVAGPRLSL